MFMHCPITETRLFLGDLVDRQPLIEGPWLIIGDFNLTRIAAERNNQSFNLPLANTLNDTIHDLGLNLEEVSLAGKRFTWTNRQPNPILARLDHAFTNLDHNMSFPSGTLYVRPTTPNL